MHESDQSEQAMSAPSISRLFSFARLSYLIGIVLALVVVIPTAWFPFQLGKVALFTTFLAISGILFVWGGGLRTLTMRRGVMLALTSVVLPACYLISYAFSANRAVGLVGTNVEIDTVLFAVLGFITLMLGFALFRGARGVRTLFATVFYSLIAAAVFQCVAVLFGQAALPFATFADRSVNLVGKWNDLGLLLGLLGMWCVGLLELVSLSRARRILAAVVYIVVAGLLALVHFDLVWELMLGSSILLGAVAYMRTPGEGASALARIPRYASASAIIAILFILFGASINTGLTKFIPVSSLEVRPSYASTVAVIQAAHGSGVREALVGTGPNTFMNLWLLNKPSAVNASLFWSLDFVVGFSTFLTAFAGAGLLGVIGWAVPFLLALLGLLKVWRSARAPEDKLLGGALGVGSLYVWIGAMLYVPSQNVLLLGFVLTGALLSFAYGEEMAQSAGNRIVRSGIGAVLLVAVLVLLVAVDSRFMSQVQVNKGLVALGNNNTTDARAYARSAEFFEKSPDAYRVEVQAGLIDLQQIASTQKPSTEDQQRFAGIASSTIAAGQAAISANVSDYRSYMLLGQVYDMLSMLGVQNAYQLSEKTYYDAAQLNPTNPQIPLLLARLEANHNNLQLTSAFLQKSLTLKPNYTDAILFAVQLYVAQKDLPNAIAAAKAAVQSAPGVPSIWFELGLLYYAGGDTKNAIDPLKQAIALQGDYANAKYFLGLSLYAQGDAQDAIAQFKDLQSTNPDNQEVALILANMEAGKAPFTSAQPPVSTNPAKRTTAPISE